MSTIKIINPISMENKYISKAIRAAAILTGSYVAWTIIWQSDNNNAQELNQLVLYISFTIWSLTSLEVKIEYSDDWVTYYQETFITISGWTSAASLWEYTFTATWNYIIASPFKAKFVKVSSKWTWTATSSSCSIKWILWIS